MKKFNQEMINKIHEVMLPLLKQELGNEIETVEFKVEDRLVVESMFVTAQQEMAAKLTKGGFNLNKKVFIFSDKAPEYTPVVSIYQSINKVSSLGLKRRFVKSVLETIAHEYRHAYQFMNGQIDVEKFIRGEYSYQSASQYKNLDTEKDAFAFQAEFSKKYFKQVLKAL
ncbi:hypothetical protein [Staphylococcus phage vB_StaM_SA1]|nr:hypothetical protein [Staphylococcus phage vB_StaM_SA1]